MKRIGKKAVIIFTVLHIRSDFIRFTIGRILVCILRHFPVTQYLPFEKQQLMEWKNTHTRISELDLILINRIHAYERINKIAHINNSSWQQQQQQQWLRTYSIFFSVVLAYYICACVRVCVLCANTRIHTN